jgi:tetratricopeptide (TPR) repeat protein
LRGSYPQAIDYHLAAASLSRKMGDQSDEAEALNGLGEVFLATGRAVGILAQHRAALGLAARIGDTYEQARAHRGVARFYHAVGDSGRARHHWQHAFDLYTALGVPEAEETRAQLTGE